MSFTTYLSAKILWTAGSAIFFILGSIHLYYTFFSHKFDARDRSVIAGMKNTSPVLTPETTMWKAWVGFNASHSAGAIFIGLVNILSAVQHFSWLANSMLFILLNLLTTGFYLWLAKKYWFRIPFLGMLIATACFLIAAICIIAG